MPRPTGPPGSGGIDLALYSAGFDATWELDVFGGVRRGVEAARANTEAAVWQLHDAEVSLTAEVADTYLTLRTAQNRIAVIQTELQRQRSLLELIKDRATTGFVTGLDVNQKTAQVESTAAQLPPLEAQTRASIHALGVLLGEQPETMAAELQMASIVLKAPPNLPVSLPSDLLRRRPDVREAERRRAAATAEVGVAVAELYPKFNLLGLAGCGGRTRPVRGRATAPRVPAGIDQGGEFFIHNRPGSVPYGTCALSKCADGRDDAAERSGSGHAKPSRHGRRYNLPLQGAWRGMVRQLVLTAPGYLFFRLR